MAVVTQSAAERYWPGRDPIGAQIQLSAGSEDWYEVVGIVANTIASSLREDGEPVVYLSYRQFSYSSNYVVVRSAANAATITGTLRSVLGELDRALPLWDVATMDERVSRITARDRFITVLLGTFGVLALLLAAVGIYGVLAFLVAQRTREVGLRMAVGATQRDVSTLVLHEGLSLVVLGLVVGAAMALALTRVLEGQLYRVSPFDPAAFGTALLVLVAAATLACWLPARRAARIDPIAALRRE